MLVSDRQFHCEYRATIRVVVRGDPAPVLLDDSVGERESQPDSMADIPCCVEGLEDARKRIIAEPGSGIPHRRHSPSVFTP